MQSFDRPRVLSLLGLEYDVVNVSERDFVTWRMLNWKGRIRGAMRIMLRALGARGSGEMIYFCAIRGNGRNGASAA